MKFAAPGNLHRDRFPQDFFDHLRKTLRIYPYVAFNARDLFTGVIPLERGRVRVRVLHALRIHGQERRLCAAPQL